MAAVYSNSFSALRSAVWRSGAFERALWEKDARSHGKHSGDSRATAAQTQTWAKGKRTRMCMSAWLTALHLWRSSFVSVLVVLVVGFLCLTPRPPSSPLNICLCLHRCSCCHLWRVNVVHNFTSYILRLRMSFCVWKHCWYTILPFSDCHSRAQHVLNIGIMGLLLEKFRVLQICSCGAAVAVAVSLIYPSVFMFSYPSFYSSGVRVDWSLCLDACFVEILCFSWIVILHGERLLKWSEISGVNSLKSWDAFVCSIPEAKFAKMIQELQCVCGFLYRVFVYCYLIA